MIMIDAFKVVVGNEEFQAGCMYGLNLVTYHFPYLVSSDDPNFGNHDTAPFHSVTIKRSKRSVSSVIIEGYFKGE